jgi:NADH dehydrogenase/NADH:ubiquinone oxidoreductase subunit G
MTLLNRQRLLYVLERTNVGGYVQISLKEGFSKLFSQAQTAASAQVIVGKAQDLESLFSAKLWFKRWFKKVSFVQDFLEDTQTLQTYFATKNAVIFDQEAFQRSSYIFLLGTHLRYDLPLLNLKIKQRVKATNVPVFVLGTPTNTTYKLYNLGSNILQLLTLLKGKNIFSSFVAKEQGFWFVHPGCFMPATFSLLKQLASVQKRIKLYIVSAYTALINMFAINFVSKVHGVYKHTAPLIYNINADDHALKAVSKGHYVLFGSYGRAC